MAGIDDYDSFLEERENIGYLEAFWCCLQLEGEKMWYDSLKFPKWQG